MIMISFIFSSGPAYRSAPGLLSEVIGADVMLDWSGAFTLNGRLLRFELYSRDLAITDGVFMKIYSGYDTVYSFRKESHQQGRSV